MISCKKATMLMTIREDRPLSRSERLGLSMHLGVCSLCRNYLTQTKLITKLMQAFSDQAAVAGNDKLSESTKQIIKQKIKQGK